MTYTGKIRRMFPGNNSSYGFYSYYDYVLPQEEASRIMIIKGGPGVGKSFFMKKLGEEMLSRGFDIEYHHCSSDPSSLDGVVIPSVKVALIDGTAPHIVDPKNPGVIDEIIAFSDFWNETGIASYKKEIIATNKEVSRLFKRAYTLLASAREINNDIEAMNSINLYKHSANEMARNLINRILKDTRQNKLGKGRHLFGSAITPDGCIDYLETLVGACSNIFYIKGEPGTGRSTLLSKIYSSALEAGYDSEAYHCALEPSRFEHVIIPSLDTALTTSPKFENQCTEIVDMNTLRDSSFIVTNKYDMEYDKNMFSRLLNEAVNTLCRVKETRKYLENLYSSNMDFDRINKLRQQILNRIMRNINIE